MPRTEKRIFFSAEEIKLMLERKHNITIKSILWENNQAVAEVLDETKI